MDSSLSSLRRDHVVRTIPLALAGIAATIFFGTRAWDSYEESRATLLHTELVALTSAGQPSVRVYPRGSDGKAPQQPCGMLRVSYGEGLEAYSFHTALSLVEEAAIANEYVVCEDLGSAKSRKIKLGINADSRVVVLHTPENAVRFSPGLRYEVPPGGMDYLDPLSGEPILPVLARRDQVPIVAKTEAHAREIRSRIIELRNRCD